MQTQNPVRNPATLLAALLNIGALTASLVLAPAAGAGATPADKRKPGLYWTFEKDKGKISCKLFEAEAPVIESVGSAPADAPETALPDVTSK
jgi:hypothetical protein